ncbi:hypothetical protein RCL1_007919 [Eukaryota sp. TZLM3-RCL]
MTDLFRQVLERFFKVYTVPCYFAEVIPKQPSVVSEEPQVKLCKEGDFCICCITDAPHIVPSFEGYQVVVMNHSCGYKYKLLSTTLNPDLHHQDFARAYETAIQLCRSFLDITYVIIRETKQESQLIIIVALINTQFRPLNDTDVSTTLPTSYNGFDVYYVSDIFYTGTRNSEAQTPILGLVHPSIGYDHYDLVDLIIRPVTTGAHIGVVTSDQQVMSGAVSTIVKQRNSQQLFLLTVHHLLSRTAENEELKPVYQPPQTYEVQHSDPVNSALIGDAHNCFATNSYVNASIGGQIFPTTVDVALAKLNAETDYCSIHFGLDIHLEEFTKQTHQQLLRNRSRLNMEFLPPRVVTFDVDPVLHPASDQIVYFFGPRTRLTAGKLIFPVMAYRSGNTADIYRPLLGTGTVDFTDFGPLYRTQYFVECFGPHPEIGDSGSLAVLVDGSVLGMIVGVLASGIVIVTPIQAIKKALEDYEFVVHCSCPRGHSDV